MAETYFLREMLFGPKNIPNAFVLAVSLCFFGPSGVIHLSFFSMNNVVTATHSRKTPLTKFFDYATTRRNYM